MSHLSCQPPEIKISNVRLRNRLLSISQNPKTQLDC